MEILLKRIARKEAYTIGRLSIDGNYVCDTLEDRDRGLTSHMSDAQICGMKVHGQTAIPTGRYIVDMKTVSPRLGNRPQYKFCQGKLPRLIGVPGYSGVLVHCGNTAKDTDGCILVGENKKVGMVMNSTQTLKRVYPLLQAADKRGERIYITIE